MVNTIQITATPIRETRNEGVTIAKAIAIILMVLGHSGCPDVINHFLGIMRMPLFFIMSGYCFKEKYIDDGRKYLKRRVTGVYVPFVKWGIFFLLLHNFIYAEQYSLPQIGYKAGCIVIGLIENEQLIGGYWFIHDLFWGSLLFYGTLKLIRKAWFAALLLGITALLMSYFSFKVSCFIYPRTALGACFIAIGHAYHVSRLSFEKNLFYITTIFVSLGITSVFWHTSFLDFTWTDVPIFIIAASAGSLMIFGIGERLSKINNGLVRKILVFVGGKTFAVLTWHMSAFKIVTVAIILIYGLEWNRFYDFPVMADYASEGWIIAYFVVGLIVPLSVYYLIEQIKVNRKKELT